MKMSSSPLLKKEPVLLTYDICNGHSMEHGSSLSHPSRYARPAPPAPVHNPADTTTTTRPRPLPRNNTVNNTTITLGQIRTGPRPQNEYVDNPAPAVPAIPPRRVTIQQQPQSVNNNHRDILHTVVPRPESETLLQSERSAVHATTPPNPTIFRQPTSVLKVPTRSSETDTHKDNIINKDLTVEQNRHPTTDSIYCPRCKKCKCYQCTQKRELPSTWICNKRFHCSATNVVEYVSCLCAVKGLFYHCCIDKDGDGESMGDDPCGCCDQAACCKRWTVMGLLSPCLPCLCLYWPLRCGVSACTSCYNRCTRRGCHCKRDKSQNISRPLIPPDSESSST